jgi:two-component system, sensor histidine kinase and response regulator
MKGFREECLDSGMDGYITKPLRREVLVGEMARVIPDLIVTSAPAPVSPETKAPRSTANLDFDVDTFLESVGGNRETLREVLGITLGEDVPRLRKLLDEAGATGDQEKLEQAAHAIKGLAAELRAEPCRLAAANLEQTRDAKDVAPLQAALGKLEARLIEIAT